MSCHEYHRAIYDLIEKMSRTAIQHPDPRLKEVARPLSGIEIDAVVDNGGRFESPIRRLIDQMKLVAAKDLGLAATQLGVPLRIIIARGTIKEDFMVLINPEVKDRLKVERTAPEGCLSIDNGKLRVTVSRPGKCTIRDFFHENINLGGMLARVVQHEIDHLDGITILERKEP